MNYIDIIFLITILFFTITGLRKGLIKSIGGIIAIIIGFYGASIFYISFSLWLQGVSGIFSNTIANIISFIVVFIIINRLVMFLVYLLDKVFSVPIVGIFNKLLGGIFGFLAGLLIVGIIVLAISSFYEGKILAFKNSKISTNTQKIIEFIKPLIPKSLDLSFLESNWINNLKNVIQNLPQNIGSVDELMSYLNSNTNLSEDIINDIKETKFTNVSIIDIDEIKIKLEEYLNNKQ